MSINALLDDKFNSDKVTLFPSKELRMLDLSLLIIYITTTTKDGKYFSNIWRKFWYIVHMFDDIGSNLQYQKWGALSPEFAKGILEAYGVCYIIENNKY